MDEHRRRAFVSWVVCAALLAGAAGAGVVSPAGAAAAQGGAEGASGGEALPAGCVVSLGALTAGSVVSRSGAWDGGDGCGSVSVEGRFARFVSFTVTEPLEARISLSGTVGKRLYLLEGAGTAGRVLSFSAARSAAAAAIVWPVLQPGSYMLEATTFSAGVEGDFGVSIDSMALSPPAGCVAALGSLAAGTITSRGGAWARADGCRSVNATSRATTRHYARYFSFAVSEPLRARLRLTGGVAKRLYLLEGAGTGGRVVDSAVSFTASEAAFWETLQPGAYTLEATTYSRAVEAGFALSVSLAVSAPTRAGALDAQAIPARRDAARVDVSGGFGGPVESYAARSSNVSVVTASVEGSVVTLHGVGVGSAMVRVTAVNAAGSASQSFGVSVRKAVAPPHATGALAAHTLTAGDSATVDVAAAFTGTVDTYTATSSDTDVATVSAAGPVLTLTGVAAGTATVTVTATNTGGSAEQAIAVTVNPAVPTATGALAAQTVTAGDSAEVDVAGAFAGTVDSYAVTSSNAAVADVALAGSVVTLTGVAAGTATVAVTAANTAGSATQEFAVTVGLPPAPTLAAALAAQALQATETIAVDVAAGFAGRIDSYAAVSGDTDTLTVAVDGSTVALTGVAVGSTTVTVTAVNAAGRAARSFNVTVNALTAPQAAGAPVARTIAVGAELAVHVADAFSGIIASYGATSNDPNVATARVEGSTVTLAGVAAGTATVTLEAVNAAGRATAALPVTVEVPDVLAVAVAAPSHCLGSEGALAPGGGRRGVGSIELTYHVTGGAGPYTITSPDAPDATRTEPTGALTVPCSRRGIDLAAAGPEVNVVEAGHRTLTLTATDNTGATATTDVQIEVAEDAYTTEYNGGTMDPGKTYVLGTQDEWVLITLPAGLTLQFTGLSENNMAHFTEPATGAEIILDWTTGTEIRRSVPTIRDTSNRAGSNAPTSINGDTVGSTGTLFDRLKVSAPDGVKFGAISTEWRPYADLPSGAQVAVRPNMFTGKSIRVCADTMDGAVTENVKLTAEDWNEKIKARNRAFPRDVFEFVPDCEDGDIDVTVEIVSDSRISNDDKCEDDVGACAQIAVVGNNPPTITGDRIFVKPVRSTVREAMVHELGHFLGLGDYRARNDSKCSTKSSDADRKRFASAMAGGDCRRDEVQDRDLVDLHKIYYPRARAGMSFVGDGSGGWELFAGSPPADLADPPHFVSNAERYLVFRRAVASGGPWSYRGWFSRHMAWRWLVPGKVHVEDEDGQEVLVQDLWIGDSLGDIVGYEFAVFGITGGDIEQTPRRGREEHATWQASAGDSEWSLGAPLIVHGPPSKPLNLSAATDDKSVVLSWDSVPGATHYHVHVYRSAATVPFRSERVEADPSSCSVRAAIPGLRARLTYGFRVEAARLGVPIRSELSERVTAGLSSGRNPRATAGSVPASGESTDGSGSCVVPVVVDPIVGVSVSCPVDEYSWTSRAVGGGYRCERLDPAAPVPGTTVVRCPSVVPRYAVVSVGGVEKCRRTLVAAPTVSLGDPECGDGFAPVGGGASCSRTDREAATATTAHECSGDYKLVDSGEPFCYRSVPATATVTEECPKGYRLAAPRPRSCLSSVPAAESVTYSCDSGYTLVRFGTPFCYRSVPATATVTEECPSGYRLVARLVGGAVARYCQKTVAAKVTYSCDSGYTRSGTSCSKYRYATPTNGACPTGYTAFFNGFAHLCRKKVTVGANVTYSCGSGYTRSGTDCVHRVAPTTRTAYSCDDGYELSGRTCTRSVAPTADTDYHCDNAPPRHTLSGTDCVHRVAPTATTAYDCDKAPPDYKLSGANCTHSVAPTAETDYHCDNAPPRHTLSGTDCVHRVAPTATVTHDCDKAPPDHKLSGTDCVRRVKPTFTVTYDCDDAPPGYNLAGTDCVKVTTQAPTRPTVYTCGAAYTRVEPADSAGAPACEKTDTVDATVTTTPRSCPTVPAGEPAYQLREDHVAGTTEHTCERTLTAAAIVEPTYECPTGYTRTKTVNSDGTEHACRLD